jgi:hypothetical protein
MGDFQIGESLHGSISFALNCVSPVSNGTLEHLRKPYQPSSSEAAVPTVFFALFGSPLCNSMACVCEVTPK